MEGGCFGYKKLIQTGSCVWLRRRKKTAGRDDMRTFRARTCSQNIRTGQVIFQGGARRRRRRRRRRGKLRRSAVMLANYMVPYKHSSDRSCESQKIRRA